MIRRTEWTKEDKEDKYIILGGIFVDSGTITIGDEVNQCIQIQTVHGDGFYPVILTEDNLLIVDLDPDKIAGLFPIINYTDEHLIEPNTSGTEIETQKILGGTCKAVH